MGILLNGGKFCSWDLTTHVNPWVQGGDLTRVWRASSTSTIGFGENFLKQNLQGAPVLGGAHHIFRTVIQIRKDLGPMYFWSRVQSFIGRVYKTKFVVHLPNKTWSGFNLLALDLTLNPGSEGPKMGLGWLCSLKHVCLFVCTYACLYICIYVYMYKCVFVCS